MRARRRIAAAVLVASAGLLLLTAAAPSAPLPSRAIGSATALDVEDFEFARLDVDYELARDDEGRSRLRVREHFVAVFPDADQNRGMRRAIPSHYDGHATDLVISSVTDETGAPRSYTAEHDGDFLVLTIAVPVGEFVQGVQHYVIAYTQRDVTRYYADTEADEFYRDVNGTGWPQPFGEVTATLTLDAGLAALVTGFSCYEGPQGSRDPCPETLSDEGTLRANSSSLGAFANLTVVAGFPPGTFAPAPFDLFAIVPLPILIGLASGLAGLLVAAYSGLWAWRDATGRGVVLAQYDPPEGVSMFLAADLMTRKSKAMAATIVDFAVRRKIRIVERDSILGRREFGLVRLADDDDRELLPEEKRIGDALFHGHDPSALTSLGVIGAIVSSLHAQDIETSSAHPVRWLAKRDSVLGQHVVRETKAARSLALSRGLRRRPSRGPVALAALLFALGVVLCGAVGLTSVRDSISGLGMLSAVATAWIGIVTLGALSSRHPLTPEGAELTEHLRGLSEFIDWAEADRLRMLQSVDGAERLSRDGAAARRDDPVRVVRVYERLLPYAVLFGQEKQWAGELSRYYAENPPEWYSGSSASFSSSAFAASFSSGIGALSSSVSSSYSGSASSSTSGGSGGGGSSGGGGGGGGGGGV